MDCAARLMVWVCPLMLTTRVAEKDCCCCGLKRTPKRAVCAGATDMGVAGRLTNWKAAGEEPPSVTELIKPVPAPELAATMVMVVAPPDNVLGNWSVELASKAMVL